MLATKACFMADNDRAKNKQAVGLLNADNDRADTCMCHCAFTQLQSCPR